MTVKYIEGDIFKPVFAICVGKMVLVRVHGQVHMCLNPACPSPADTVVELQLPDNATIEDIFNAVIKNT